MTNEKQLIDVKPLMKNGWHLVRTGESNRFLQSMSLADVPTVDAVEVVRCKDCSFIGWRGTNTNDCGYFYCRHPSGLRVIKDAHSSYCDFGERKDKDE